MTRVIASVKLMFILQSTKDNKSTILAITNTTLYTYNTIIIVKQEKCNHDESVQIYTRNLLSGTVSMSYLTQYVLSFSQRYRLVLGMLRLKTSQTKASMCSGEA